MSKQIIYAAVILLALAIGAQAHEPTGLRLIREYHQRNARVQAEAARARQQFAEWQQEWHRQAQVRQAVQQKASGER
jgi:hypothetical protein